MMKILKNSWHVCFWFLWGAYLTHEQGEPLRITLTRATLFGFFGFSLEAIPALFRHADGSPLTVWEECGQSLARCLAFFLAFSSASFYKSDADYWFRFQWLGVAMIAAWALLVVLAILKSRRSPHRNVTKL